MSFFLPDFSIVLYMLGLEMIGSKPKVILADTDGPVSSFLEIDIHYVLLYCKKKIPYVLVLFEG